VIYLRRIALILVLLFTTMLLVSPIYAAGTFMDSYSKLSDAEKQKATNATKTSNTTTTTNKGAKVSVFNTSSEPSATPKPNFIEKFATDLLSSPFELVNTALTENGYSMEALITGKSDLSRITFKKEAITDGNSAFVQTGAGWEKFDNRKTTGIIDLANKQGVNLNRATMGIKEMVSGITKITTRLAFIILPAISFAILFLFIRSGDDFRRKLQLKEYGFRLLTTIVLFSLTPTLIEMMLNINNSLVSAITKEFMATMGVTSGSITGAIKEAMGYRLLYVIVIALMLIVTIRLMVFYAIRLFTVLLLYALYPLTSILYTFNKDIYNGWLKELSGNIFIQSIQMFAFAGEFMVINQLTKPAVTNSLGVVTEGGGVLASQPIIQAIIYVIAVGTLPMISQALKHMLGFEGHVGANHAGAGMAGLDTARNVLRDTVAVGAAGANLVKQGISGLASSSTLKTLENKNVAPSSMPSTSSSVSSNISSMSNPVLGGGMDLKKNAASSAAPVFSSTKDSVKNIAKGAASIVGGGYGAVFGAALLGNRGAHLGAAYGATKLGNMASGVVGAGMVAMEKPQVHQMAANTAFGAKEGRAVKSREVLQELGLNALANAAYAAYTPTRKSADEIQKMNDAMYYQDTSKSFMYRDDDEGNREILWMGEGDSSLTSPINRQVDFSNPEVSIASSIKTSINDRAIDKAEDYMMNGIGMKYSDNKKEYDKIFDNQRQGEYQKLQQTEIKRTESARKSTGMNLNFASNDMPVTFANQARIPISSTMSGTVKDQESADINNMPPMSGNSDYSYEQILGNINSDYIQSMNPIDGRYLAIANREGAILYNLDGDQVGKINQPFGELGGDYSVFDLYANNNQVYGSEFSATNMVSPLNINRPYSSPITSSIKTALSGRTVPQQVVTMTTDSSGSTLLMLNSNGEVLNTMPNNGDMNIIPGQYFQIQIDTNQNMNRSDIANASNMMNHAIENNYERYQDSVNAVRDLSRDYQNRTTAENTENEFRDSQ